MNLFTNKHRLTDLENELMAASGEEVGSMGSNTHTVFKTDNQKGPTVQLRELCSVLCGILDGSVVWERMDTCRCIAGFLCGFTWNYRNIANWLYSDIKYIAFQKKTKVLELRKLGVQMWTHGRRNVSLWIPVRSSSSAMKPLASFLNFYNYLDAVHLIWPLEWDASPQSWSPWSQPPAFSHKILPPASLFTSSLYTSLYGTSKCCHGAQGSFRFPVDQLQAVRDWIWYPGLHGLGSAFCHCYIIVPTVYWTWCKAKWKASLGGLQPPPSLTWGSSPQASEILNSS